MRPLILIGFALALSGLEILLPPSALGQGASPAPSPSTSTRPDAFWRCELPGGVYLIALRNIASISSHEYVVDAVARVTEVTIATNGSVEARFYYLEPLSANAASSSAPTATLGTLQQLQQKVQDAVTSRSPVEPPWQKVMKNYPTTTHAHTVEYRLDSKQDLQSLYQNLEQAWTTNRGYNFKAE
jgi:hypothetical protein